MFFQKSYKFPNLKKTYKNKQKYLSFKKKTYIFKNLEFRKNYKKNFFSFHIPFSWDIILCFRGDLNCYIYNLFNGNYSFVLPVRDKMYKTIFDPNSRSVVIYSFYLKNNIPLFKYYYTHIFKIANVPSFIKIKFKGKGYYLFKNKRNTITPQFNYAHRIYVYSFFVHMKFLSKTSIIIFGYQRDDLFKSAYNIKAMRPINIFTGRGVRFNRQIIRKKTGKVSAYR